MTLAQLSNANDRMKTREEIVADALRDAILRGTFKPGEKLDQSELAEILGVSRSPVREALRTLAAEELVTNVPHRGSVVTERSRDELEELLFMRILLEGAAARRAAGSMTPERLEKLEQILIKGENATNEIEVLGLNNDFHTTVYAAYAQPILINTIQQLRNKVAPYNRLYLGVEGRKEAAWADHRRIYEACLAGDPKAAERETRNHLNQVFEGILIAAS